MGFQISEKAKTRLYELKRNYPEPQSAVMAALYLVQEELGYISEEGIVWISEQLQMPAIRVREMATFYTLYRTRPVGKYHVQLCRTLSCAVAGAPDLAGYLRQRLQIKPGEVSADGLWSYEFVECLGSCGTGPAAQINDTYFEKLNPEKLAALMDRIERELPDLSFSTVRDAFGAGLAGVPRSQIYRGPGETA